MALLLGVLLLHLLLLQAMVGSRSTGTHAAEAGPMHLRVRSIPLVLPVPAALQEEAARPLLARAAAPVQPQRSVSTPPPPPTAEAPQAEPQGASPALSTATATPRGPAGEPLPSHRAELPPPFEARFQVQRGGLSGHATWTWQPEGEAYLLNLQTQVLGRDISHVRSRGRIGAAGLEPLRFVDGRRGRDQRAVNFRRDEPGGDRISFSGPAADLALPAGVQDRLSWLLQLAAIADGMPELREAGRELAMWVVGPRGDADIWTFVVTGTPTLAASDGHERPMLAMRRQARRAWDTEVEVWLDPASRHLPMRARWRTAGAGEGTGVDLWLQGIDWQRPP